MGAYDLVIRGGTLVTTNGVHSADVAIADERIVAIAPELSGSVQAVIDAHNLHIFPGVIDAHVHFNEPGRTAWEGFASGSKALAAGGTTTFFDMPLNSHPPTLDAASFAEKLAAAQASSYVDFGLWGGLVPGNIEQLDELAACGVVGFKAFMSNSGIEDFQSVDDATLYQGMQRSAQLGKLVAVHAENDQLTAGLARQARTQGRVGIRDYLASRPVVAELEAIERAIIFAEETGCALHIVHVSSGRGVLLVASARTRGVNVSCETCPHYLVLTEEDMEELGVVAKCAPPLRSLTEQAALWQHLFSGTLPMVASDHSPAPFEMKERSDFFEAWGGISGCQSLLALLLTEGYHQRHLPLELIVAATSEYVARRFNLPACKGQLEVGTDADLSLVDLTDSYRLESHNLFYQHPYSPYLGRAFRGRIVRTLVRGQTVFLDGKIVSPPIGHLLKPFPFGVGS
ncbi:allantoinase [Dictyobacter formicarum]|uniref:Allantoinase n=1 Tax=Dictyobacter formicarum TaxID=2778368 RepID=A0ABQ3VGM6_9CHLR|nr:allantoinase [Dictyobacter formicarum]GHO85334.1 cyclic amidohydrolase [Dictyobacter formicarum]